MLSHNGLIRGGACSRVSSASVQYSQKRCNSEQIGGIRRKKIATASSTEGGRRWRGKGQWLSLGGVDGDGVGLRLDLGGVGVAGARVLNVLRLNGRPGEHGNDRREVLVNGETDNHNRREPAPDEGQRRPERKQRR
eukprot:5884670-Pleurochrysis_carterae.AAC.2